MNGDKKLQNWRASPDKDKEATWRLDRTNCGDTLPSMKPK